MRNVALLNDCQGWWAEHCELKKKFGMEGEVRSSRLSCNMDKLHAGCSWGRMAGRSGREIWSLISEWYRLAKEDFG